METSHAGQKAMTGTKRAREGYGCAQLAGIGIKWTSDRRVQLREVSMLLLTYLSLRAVPTTFRIHKIWAHVSHVAPRGALCGKMQPE